MRRLFFALWPDDAVRSQLHLAYSNLAPPASSEIALHNLHLTLLFLGDVTHEMQQCVERCAAAVVAKGFALALDTLGFWSSSRILWIGPSHAPLELKFLVTSLSDTLKECGFQPEKREYRPHITLSRKASKPRYTPIIEPITWVVKNFALMESRPRAGKVDYVMLKSWSLNN